MENRKRRAGRRFLSVMLTMILAVTLFAAIPEKDMATVQAETGITLQNPRRDSDGNMTWDCVYFGSYPQAEVITAAMAQNYTSVNSAYRKDSDVVVADDVYAELQSATDWDANNDITLNGTKYRRMKQGDATYAVDDSHYYSWSDSTTYHYFQYQPIKWRVLNVAGEEAVLLSDIGLDDQRYNEAWTDVTWGTSTIRSWLNGYGSSENAYGTDYSSSNFINSAFSSAEQGAIVATDLENADNSYYETDGGNDTTDKIFLVSESEIYGTDTAKSYGFAESYDTYDKARRRQSSTYAKAMGVWSYYDEDDEDREYNGNCWWWLRSPGYHSFDAMYVYFNGWVHQFGNFVGSGTSAVCPALHLNLSSSNLWSHAGTVSVQGSAEEVEPSPDTPSEEQPTDSTTEQPAAQPTDKATTEQPATQSATSKTTTEGNSSLPAVGTTKTLSTGTYKVTDSSSTKKQVTFVKPKSTKKTSVSIPATVKIEGQTYKVTEIAAKAMKNNKKLKSVTIGKNVTKIGKEAFSGSKKLSKITIKSAVLKSVGKNAVKGISKSATIKVPKKQFTKYKGLFKSSTGFKKTMKVKK